MMGKRKQSSAREKFRMMRGNKLKRNWYLGQEQILYIQIFAKRFGLPQAEVLRRFLRILMSMSEDFLNERISKV